jgi:hypothetical protein
MGGRELAVLGRDHERLGHEVEVLRALGVLQTLDVLVQPVLAGQFVGPGVNVMIKKYILANCLFKKLPPYTPAGFNLTTHNSVAGVDSAKPCRQGISGLLSFTEKVAH